MKKILIYSDCFTYSGSENVIENIISSKEINAEFDVHFAYARNKQYTKAFWRRIGELPPRSDVNAIFILSKGYYSNKFRNKQYTIMTRCLYLSIALVIASLEFVFIAHLYNLIRLFILLIKERPDIFYINNGGYPGATSCRLAVIAARWAKVKHVIFNVNNMAFPAKNFFDRYLDVYVKSNVDRFITASYAAQTRLINIRDFPAEKFIRIPNTLFESKFQIDHSFNANLDKNYLNIVSIGLLTHRKGFHILLEAAKSLINKGYNNFRIYIIGEGEERTNLEKQITSLALGKYVQLLGFIEAPQNTLNQMDLFVLPSVANEDFPYVNLEAMYLSKPIIGTDVAGMPEQIVDGKTGFIVEPANVNDLADAIKKFLLEPDLIKGMGKLGYERYCSNFSYQRVELEYLTLFKNLIR